MLCTSRLKPNNLVSPCAAVTVDKVDDDEDVDDEDVDDDEVGDDEVDVGKRRGCSMLTVVAICR